jgi:glycerol uptake facilitator-like aquaporin
VDSILEFTLTSALLFGVTTIIRVIIGPSPISRAVPNIHLQLALIGASVGFLLVGLILSPLGRASGAHMNPAVSFAMAGFGVFPRTFVAPYIVAQLLGSVVGVFAARLAWGPVIATRPVEFAVLQPGAGWTQIELFVGEAVATGALVLIVGLCLSVAHLAPHVPRISGAVVALAIALLGTATGASLNPARQFGPAVASGQMHFLYIYLSAPMAGALLAVWLRSRLQQKHVLTHRLCGTI